LHQVRNQHDDGVRRRIGVVPKLGLVNEIAKASGMAPPNPGADLVSALSGKGLGAEGVNAVNSALSSAADQVGVAAAQKTALMSLLTPITNAVAGQ
jgi:hypothetical protein